MRKIYTMLFTLIVLLSMAMSAEALGSKTFERHNGGSAYADWTEVNGDITTSKYLSVTETDAGTDVYLDIYTWGPDYWSGESGYMFTKDDIFSIDKKLNSASLSQVDITVNDWNTGEPKTLAVKADWTGKGDVSTAVLHQLDQKIIYPHYDFKHLTEKYFEIGMKLDDFLIQLVKY